MNKKKILALALAVTTAVSTLIPNAGIFTPIRALAGEATPIVLQLTSTDGEITLTVGETEGNDSNNLTKISDNLLYQTNDLGDGERASFDLTIGGTGITDASANLAISTTKAGVDAAKTAAATNRALKRVQADVANDTEVTVYYSYKADASAEWSDVGSIVLGYDHVAPVINDPEIYGAAITNVTDIANTTYNRIGGGTIRFPYTEALLKSATYTIAKDGGTTSSPRNYTYEGGIPIPNEMGSYVAKLTLTDKAGNGDEKKVEKSVTVNVYKANELTIECEKKVGYTGSALIGALKSVDPDADIKITSSIESAGAITYNYKTKGSDSYSGAGVGNLPTDIGEYTIKVEQAAITGTDSKYYAPATKEFDLEIEKGDLSKIAGTFTLGGTSATDTDASDLSVSLNREYTKDGEEPLMVDASALTYYSVASDGKETALTKNPGKTPGSYAVYANLTSDQVNKNYKAGVVKAGNFVVYGGDLKDKITSLKIVDATTGVEVTSPEVGQTLKAEVVGFPSEFGEIAYKWTVNGSEVENNKTETFTVPKGYTGQGVKVEISDKNKVYLGAAEDGKTFDDETIVAKKLVVKSVTVESTKEFDNTTDAKVTNIEFESGLIGTDKLADIVDMDEINATATIFATYNDENVGSNKKISFNYDNLVSAFDGGTDVNESYALVENSSKSNLAALDIKAAITPYVADPVNTITNLTVAEVKTGEDVDNNTYADPYNMVLEDVKAITYDASAIRITSVCDAQNDITYKAVVEKGLEYLDSIPVVDATDAENSTAKIEFNKEAIDKIDGVATVILTIVDTKSDNYVISGTMTINVTNKNLVTFDDVPTGEEYGKAKELEYSVKNATLGDVLPLIQANGKASLTIYDGEEDVTELAKAGILDVGTYTLVLYAENDKYFGSKESEYEVTQSNTALKASDFELSTDKAELGGEAPEAILIKKAADGVTNLSLGKAVATIKYLKKDSDYASTGVEFEEITEAGEYDAYVSVEDLEGETGNFAELDEGEDTYIGTITVGEAVEKFTVSFTDEDGNLIESQQVASGEKATKPADPTKDGYEFLGWFVSGAEEAYSFDTAVTADTTLVAKFKMVDDQETAKYTVSFTDEEGNLITSQQVASGEKATKPADPTKDGYEFLGWFASGAEEAYSFDTAITADTTLVAKFKKTSTDDNKQEGSNEGTGTTTGSSTDVTPSNNSGSGGGGGSSNAKTVKNADGSTTTTTTTAKGTIETTTKTNADGSKTTSKVVKNKDGSGSVTETSVSAAGTTKVVEVVTDTTGAATEVTTSVSNAKGASMKVTYAAKGTAITVSKVETTGKTAVSIPATVKVGGKTYKVTKIAASALKGNKEITKVTLGANVKSIGKNAFNGDSKLKTIVMKKAPTTVGKNAFKGIAKKATIKIKASKKAFKKAKTLIKKSGIASTVKIKRTK